ncbi:protein unc-93 homolog A [Procambarus clarkii]|uniref:protein unc-93 homolog A n=1 Tax=Procambarus clarkii TaxID=6728 RepID=UPI0037435EAB
MEEKEERTGLDNAAFNSEELAQSETRETKERHVEVEKSTGKVGRKDLTPEEKKEKFAIMKNIFLISVAFTFLFTSYNSMSNLQSSINKVDGTASLTALYATYIFSCCFLPSWLLTVLKEKYTMAASMLCYSSYIAAQFYPEFYTLVPTAVILGLGAAPLWSSKCTYLTKAGMRYAELAGENSDVIITKFFGIFFMFFQSTQVWGSLIASSVLSVGVEEPNGTHNTELLSCGYNFCIGEISDGSNSSDSGGREGPPLWQIYTMASIYLVFSLFSCVVVLVFVDPLSSFKEIEGSGGSGKSSVQLLVATFTHLRHPYQLLIVPLTIWSGLEQGFLTADYTAAYVSCGLGVHMVGYVIVCYGVCDALCSVGLSRLVKVLGRVPVFTLGFLCNSGLIVALVYWRPHPDDLVWFFVIAGFWGAADAVWQTQINALYGVIFPGTPEAAFSNYRLWECLGFLIAYACSSVLCIDAKITILVVFLVVGIVGYYAIEVLEKMGGLKRNQNGSVIPLDRLIAGLF